MRPSNGEPLDVDLRVPEKLYKQQQRQLPVQQHQHSKKTRAATRPSTTNTPETTTTAKSTTKAPKQSNTSRKQLKTDTTTTTRCHPCQLPTLGSPRNHETTIDE